MAGARNVAWLVVALTAFATSARAQDLGGTWRVEPASWRKLVVSAGGQARLDVEWPERGLVSLVGVVQGGAANLSASESATPGLAGTIEGRRAKRPRAPLSVRVRLTRDDADGARADATWSEGERVVRQEVWTRPGPPTLEVLSLTPEGAWAPKSQGPLTVRFRLVGAPVALRLRVIVDPSGDRGDEVDEMRVGFYQSRIGICEDYRWPSRVTIFERALAEFEPGEHEVTWDGRDGSSDKRIALGGRYRLVLLGDGVRAEGRVRVAPPRSEYVGPRWPMHRTKNSRNEPKVDLGRDRRPAHSLSEGRLEDLGFTKPPATHLAGVTATETFEALETAAMVTIATHGNVDHFAVYADGRDDEQQAEDIQVIRPDDIDARDEALNHEKPLADLHTIILSACLTGAGDAVVPRRLIAQGADVVVCFTSMIISFGHEKFLARVLAASFDFAEGTRRRLNIQEVTLHAAQVSDGVTWRQDTAEQRAEVAEWRALGARPLREALRVEVAPGLDPKREQLAPAKWGCSTN